MCKSKLTRTTVTEVWLCNSDGKKESTLSRSICEETMTDDGDWENTNEMMRIKIDSNKYCICKNNDN